MANKEIIKIEPTLYPKIKSAVKKHGKLKVAAYARVSTEKDNQAHSLIAQKEHYTKIIQANDDWEFAGLFADEGISGTSFKKRVAFQEMIEKAKNGEVEYIITKAISRFARNTVDTLTTVRMLKSIGVGVWFEKEGIDTFDSKGEFVITLMSSLAQEESRSISENIVWGQRKRFADGKATAPFSRFLGYDMGKNGEFVVNEEQAKVVRAMFAMAVLGMPYGRIQQRLNQLGILTATGKKFGYSTVTSILKNEKYKGDALLQKTFTADFLTKRKKKNEGELPQYYVEGHHDSLVSSEVFDYVNAQDLTGRSTADAFARKIICDECGSFYGPRTWHTTNPKSISHRYRTRVWQCKHLTACGTPHIYDNHLQLLLNEVIRLLLKERNDLAVRLSEILEKDATSFLSDIICVDREDVAMIIEKMTVNRDRELVFTLVDGSEVKLVMGVWTPTNQRME